MNHNSSLNIIYSRDLLSEVSNDLSNTLNVHLGRFVRDVDSITSQQDYHIQFINRNVSHIVKSLWDDAEVILNLLF